MTLFRGTWSARVEQEFEVEADTEEEARGLLEELMTPRHVVELLDFQVETFERVETDCA